MAMKPKYPIVNGIKTCGKCKQPFQVENFYSRTRANGNVFLASWCIGCVKKNTNRHYHANREKYQAISKKWKEDNEERHKFLMWRSTIMRKYGLTPEAWAKLAGDPPHCAICGAQRTNKQSLHVDHKHGTTIVRGILCVLCNRAIERMEAVQDWAAKAQAYLAAAA